MISINRIYLLACLILAPSAARADNVYLQPESIYLGDVTELVIEYENSIPSLYALNTAALEAEFELLEKKSRIIRVNEAGDVFHRMQWRLQIAPRRIGSLTIPTIKFGDRSTPPLALEVKPVPAETEAANRVFVAMDTATPAPYVGQQTQVRLRLYSNTALADGRLDEPQADGNRMHHGTAEKRYSINRNGQSFQVLERNLVLFPGNVGDLELAPASYRGALAGRSRGDGTGRRIHRQSERLKLQVRPPPAEYDGRFWLPASQLEIIESFDGAGDQLQIGDPLDWTLTIISRGLPAESLPQDLLSLDSDNFRIYADRAIRHNRFEDGQIVGRLDQRFAVVATAPGQIKLPAINLKWWDVENDRAAETRLEGRNFTVIEPALSSGQPAFGEGLLAALRLTGNTYRPWIYFLLVLIVLAILVPGFGRLRHAVGTRLGRILYRREIRKNLELACLADDAMAARSALVDWARERWPKESIVGLQQIAVLMASAELRALFDELDAALYSRQECDWQGHRLWRLIAAAGKRHRPRAGAAADDRLPRLYPG
ncbi:MAG: BatD family protein [Gammaproteobacteria bacterium]|nr:MAG: hypothetical protein EP300_15115 [Gammaproteobacteria bacterium]UCH41806.1 MAG: BatD family protein [Gammaproteobacteria bacterium]